MLSLFRKGIDEYGLIAEGDKIAVGVSGGKDSVTLLYLLAKLKVFYPKKYSLLAINIDLGFKEKDEEGFLGIEKLCKELDVEYISVKTDIAQIVFDERKESNPCSLCAKMRKGALMDEANKNGCNKVALGHHKDDFIETFFLSLFYEGRLSTLSPHNYMSRSEITQIRPMLYLEEKNIIAFSRDLPVAKSYCPMDKRSKREEVKKQIDEIKKDIPFVRDRIFSAIVSPERYNLFDKYPKNTDKY